MAESYYCPHCGETVYLELIGTFAGDVVGKVKLSTEVTLGD